MFVVVIVVVIFAMLFITGFLFEVVVFLFFNCLFDHYSLFCL